MNANALAQWITRRFKKAPPKKIIIRSADGKKYLGYVQDRTYVTERDAKKHYFYKFGGYSISLDVLERLRNSDVQMVEIVERREHGGRLLKSKLSSWFENGESYIYKGDSQRVLPEKYFTTPYLT